MLLPQHYTTLHYTTLHYTTLHYTTLHYTHNHLRKKVKSPIQANRYTKEGAIHIQFPDN